MSRPLGALKQKLVRRHKYFREQFRRHRYFREQVQMEWCMHLHTLNGQSRLGILPGWYCQHTVCIEDATAGPSLAQPTLAHGNVGRSPGKSTFHVHKVQLQQKDTVSSQGKWCDFHCAFFSQGEKVYTRGVSRAGRLRVCLRRHLRKPCRRLKVRFSYGNFV